MNLSTIDQGIATQIGHYADAVVIPAGYDRIGVVSDLRRDSLIDR